MEIGLMARGTAQVERLPRRDKSERLHVTSGGNIAPGSAKAGRRGARDQHDFVCLTPLNGRGKADRQRRTFHRRDYTLALYRGLLFWMTANAVPAVTENSMSSLSARINP